MLLQLTAFLWTIYRMSHVTHRTSWSSSWLIDLMIMSMGRDLRLRTAAIKRGDGWHVRVESHDDEPAGENSWLVHQSSLAILPASRRTRRRRETFAYQSVSEIRQRIFYMPQNLRHEACFTSHPKEDVLRIFITLKIHSLGLVWGRMVNIPASYSGSHGLKSRPRRPAILIEVFRSFISPSGY
jgi:hypothetical protein